MPTVIARSKAMVSDRTAGRDRKLAAQRSIPRPAAALQRPREVRQIVARIGERIGHRLGLERVVGQLGLDMLERDDAVEAELGRLPGNVATATELSKTSCTQRSCAGCGTMSSCVPIRRRSWLSRGRNIIRCSPKPTGSE